MAIQGLLNTIVTNQSLLWSTSFPKKNGWRLSAEGGRCRTHNRNKSVPGKRTQPLRAIGPLLLTFGFRLQEFQRLIQQRFRLF